MTRWKTRGLVVMIAGGLLAISPLNGQPRSEVGGSAGAPFRMGTNARSIGLGNAVIAVLDDAPAFTNAALAPFLERRSALFTAGLLTLNRRIYALSYSSRLEPTAGIMLGLISAGVGEIQGRDNNGTPTEVYSTSENVASLSFALKVNSRLALGISPKIFYYALFDEVSSTTVGFDVGAVYRIAEEWTLALSIQDLGSKYKWDTSRLYGVDGNSTVDQFPVRNRFGVSYHDRLLGVLAAAEFEVLGSSNMFKAGAEWSPVDGIALRAGIDQISVNEEILAKPSFGFTVGRAINDWDPSLSYVYVLEPYGPGGLHFLTLSVGF